METFVMPLSKGLAGDLGGAAGRDLWGDASATDAEPFPLRNRENMGRLLSRGPQLGPPSSF